MKIQNGTWYFDHFHLIKTNATFLGISLKLEFMGDVKSESLQFYESNTVLICQ